MIALVVILPLVIGAATGILAGLLMKKERSSRETLLLLILNILIASGVGFIFNDLVMPKPVLNFMLIGMAFSAAFSNLVTETRLEEIMRVFNPFFGISMILVILNLVAPLDYHLIMGAGLFTVIYIAARALGKYCGAYFGQASQNHLKLLKNFWALHFCLIRVFRLFLPESLFLY